MIKVGDTFNRLTIIEINVDPPKEKKYAKQVGKWHRCRCLCNRVVTVPEMSLINGSAQSCGCYRKENSRKLIEINRERMRQNGNNTAPTSKTYSLEYNGETKSLTQWADDIGISKQALSRRLKNKSIEEALNMKGRSKNGN